MADIFTPSWDDAINPDRTEIVFEHRNKAYGAYLLRKDYQRNISKALITSVVLFTIGVSAPVIMRLISGAAKSDKTEQVEVVVDLKEPPPIDKNEPSPPPPPPPPPTIETVKFTPPVVVDHEVEEAPPPQEKLSETNVGVVTQAGEEGATELPPEPVVADPDEGKVFQFVQEPPTFPGGEELLYKYLGSNIKYPPLARENGITGKVFVSFIVDTDGKITEAKVLRSLGGGCDEEALRVVKSMPNWKPGKNNGHTVKVQYNLPINFKLQ
jgi:protein TonB